MPFFILDIWQIKKKIGENPVKTYLLYIAGGSVEW